ncbi:MAG: hypothetical protein JSR45_00425 [Proteobacteria bacterium]|nr:hypothetical protein [Pseudomonadota bacterium]
MDTDPTAKAAHADLAYLRGLVDNGGRNQMTLGLLLFAGGLIYGLQVLGHWAQATGALRLSGPGGLALGLGPTVVFLAFLSWVLWRERKHPVSGSANRATNAAFAAAGMANLSMIAVFGMAAVRYHSLVMWEFYPAVVFALQGAAWFVAFMLRRRAWLCVVSLGWFGTAVALGAAIDTPDYPLIAAIGLLAWMAAPGLVIMRLARAEQAA